MKALSRFTLLALFLGAVAPFSFTSSAQDGEGGDPFEVYKIGDLNEEEPKEREENKSAGLDLQTIQEFRRLDRNHDGKLSRLEFVGSDAAQRAMRAGGRERGGKVFKAIDRNGDDSVGLFELARSQANRNVRLLDRETDHRLQKIDDNVDGFIDRREFSDTRAAEFARALGKSPKEVTEIFARMDLNDSGIIGPFEFLQAQPDRDKHLMNRELATRFAKLDANDNGAVGRLEFGRGEFAEKARERGDQDSIGEVFKKMDLNGNGEVGPREFAKFQESVGRKGIDKETLKDFSDLDRNRDGSISRREYSRSRFASMTRDRDRVDQMFDRIDQNDDDEISLREFADRFSGGFGPGPGRGGFGPPFKKKK